MCFSYFCLWVCDGSGGANTINGKIQWRAEPDLHQGRGTVHDTQDRGVETLLGTSTWLRAERKGQGTHATLNCPAFSEDSVHAPLIPEPEPNPH